MLGSGEPSSRAPASGGDPQLWKDNTAIPRDRQENNHVRKGHVGLLGAARGLSVALGVWVLLSRLSFNSESVSHTSLVLLLFPGQPHQLLPTSGRFQEQKVALLLALLRRTSSNSMPQDTPRQAPSTGGSIATAR